MGEQRAHFALWALLKSPLIIGADLRKCVAGSCLLLLRQHMHLTRQLCPKPRCQIYPDRQPLQDSPRQPGDPEGQGSHCHQPGVTPWQCGWNCMTTREVDVQRSNHSFLHLLSSSLFPSK